MKTLPDILVYAVNFLQACCKVKDAGRREAYMYFGLSEMNHMLRQLPDVELDSLATAAKRALVEELDKAEKADPDWIGYCKTWMEDHVDEPFSREPTWAGNDRIDPVAFAIAGYHQAQDKSGELDMILVHAKDPRVFDLLLTIIADAQVDPMARTKVMQHFQYATIEKEEDQNRLVQILLQVIQTQGDPTNLDDQLLREYAAIALTYYADLPEVEAPLFKILMNPQEDGAVRSAAFQTLCRRGDSEARAKQFRTLLNDKYLGEQIMIYFRLRERRTNK